MFNKDEINFLLNCVDKMPVSSTAECRNKAIMSMKLCDLLDAPDAPPEEPKDDKKKK